MKLESACFHTLQYAVGSRCGNVDLCVPDTEAWEKRISLSFSGVGYSDAGPHRREFEAK